MLAAVVAAYIIFVMVLIYSEPEPGFPTQQELVAQLERSAESGDADQTTLLFPADVVNDDYVSGFHGRLASLKDATIRVKMTSEDRGVLCFGEGSTAESLLAVEVIDDRFYIDPIPLLTPRQGPCQMQG